MRHPCLFAVLAALCAACSQKAPPMTEAQLIGKWSCDPSKRQVSDGEYETISTIEYRADRTYQGVVTFSYSASKNVIGYLAVRAHEEGTWRIDGDELEFTNLVFEVLSTSNPRFGPKQAQAVEAGLPPSDGVRREWIRAFDGKQRTMDETGFLGAWIGEPWACSKL